MTEDKNKYLIISNPIWHEKFIWWFITSIILLIVSVFFIATGLTNRPFIDLVDIFFGIPFLVAFFIVLIKGLNFKIVKITNNQLIVKSITGKTFITERNNIKSFYELNFKVKKRSGMDVWEELLLFTDSEFVKISSKISHDYIQLKNILTKGIPKYKDSGIYDRKKALKANLLKAILFFLLGVLCITYPSTRLFYIKYIKSDITHSQLIELKGTIENSPERIQAGRRRKREIGVEIKLREYPYFEFNFYKHDFIHSKYNNFKNALVAGKPISVYVSLDEYKKKISKELPIKFNDKYFNFNNIEVFWAESNDGLWRTGTIRQPNMDKPIGPKNLTLFIRFLLISGFIGAMIGSVYYGYQFWKEYNKVTIRK